jgi:hypothetical protein
MARPTAIRPVLAMRELAAPVVGSGAVPGAVPEGTSSVGKGAVVVWMMVVGPVGVVELETVQEEAGGV